MRKITDERVMPENAKPETKVLVVDDDDDECLLARTELEDRGYLVETACDGSEALCKIYRFNPAIVLLDLYMPGLSGEELVSMIKAFRPEIAIFIVSGSINSEVQKYCLGNGALAYFEKPVDYEALDKKLIEVSENKKDTPPTSKTLTESEIRDVDIILKLLEKKEVMTRKEVLAEAWRLRSRK